ncbi:MAG: S-methyl-5-thioribose-1-phosphate isomerase [Phycisphaerales bacterium]|jgi:methylthioribose-1-phosphate isomerase|nr:S-methyl-5-thioribose-1-phosphate isomerase [Phycisphaerales bacterium]
MTTSSPSLRPPVEVASWKTTDTDGILRLLDQTQLPEVVEFKDCPTVQDTYDAIQTMVVRGAPAIGVAAGYGMVLAAREAAGDWDEFLRLGEFLASSRPTAVNLAWAVNRMTQVAKENGLTEDILLDQACKIHAEDEKMCLAIGRNAAPVLSGRGGILTHCNAGALATGGIGTATAGMYTLHASGEAIKVYCDETRPLLQGSRLTAWELQQASIDATVICDNMAGALMRDGKIGVVIVGADRIAANGDAANKIGTYPLAIVAAHHNIPMYVAAPSSTFDMTLASGAEIPIEERDGDEIVNGFGRRTGPTGISTENPAFDVTPASLLAGIVTERGVISPVTTEAVAAHWA